MSRTLRSLAIGDNDCYFSPYLHGAAQGVARLGHLHSTVNIRAPLGVIAKRIDDVRPDVIWTQMLLWAPDGSPPREQLIELMERAARRGARIVIHDADAKAPTRHPHDISAWCSLALVNHAYDRSAWKVPTLHWPYFAFSQDRIADSVPEWRCGLFFAGQLASGPVYSDRTRLVEAVRRSGADLRTPRPEDGNTLLRTPEIAASADAVLGFGRPDIPGWRDTRPYQYGGAGGIVLHDHAPDFEPWLHFVPYKAGDPESVVEALARLRNMTEAARRDMRRTVFRFVQEHHSSVPRVRQVLETLGLT